MREEEKKRSKIKISTQTILFTMHANGVYNCKINSLLQTKLIDVCSATNTHKHTHTFK